ncbi:hypothetical protein PPTG_09725 [Phytophthora nicotianae INRA-310]|uniref:Uncharacterized protein n=1 Tax=Phytophthora nicotianae (strain INRA-310) TaxID=761204 RepID=W2QFY7_PHYN3|nr:hypothetical protein PPTG_09725 [Phytophthora nicotianae INRA-310]ETN12082.1 hypothetical protein PPTG_09725 [Phytophthora nicotianae INRA-310]
MVSCGTTLPLDDVMLLLQGDVLLLLLDAKEVVLDDVLLLVADAPNGKKALVRHDAPVEDAGFVQRSKRTKDAPRSFRVNILGLQEGKQALLSPATGVEDLILVVFSLDIKRPAADDEELHEGHHLARFRLFLTVSTAPHWRYFRVPLEPSG